MNKSIIKNKMIKLKLILMKNYYIKILFKKKIMSLIKKI